MIPSGFANKHHPDIISPVPVSGAGKASGEQKRSGMPGAADEWRQGVGEPPATPGAEEDRAGKSCECEKTLLYNRACYYSTSTKGGRALKSLPVLRVQSGDSSLMS